MELQVIQKKIHEIRGCKIMIDFDLAEMYQIETKQLNLSVRRNIKRFPDDFMFQLTKKEWDSLRLQIETSKRGGRRYMPYAFSEQGVAMLSSVLNSPLAIGINISIMRAFVAIRGLIISNTIPQSIEARLKILEEANEELLKEINDLSEDGRKEFDEIYLALAELANKQKRINKPRNPIGYVKPSE